MNISRFHLFKNCTVSPNFQKQGSMTMKCQRTNPWHCVEETQDTYNHLTARTQLRQSNQLSLPEQDNCRTLGSYNYITKQAPARLHPPPPLHTHTYTHNGNNK